jgi:hypothetical protein
MLRRLSEFLGLRGAALVPWRWTLAHLASTRHWSEPQPAGSAQSADWHEMLDDAFEAMDANLSQERARRDRPGRGGASAATAGPAAAATSAAASLDVETAKALQAFDPAPPFVERRRPPVQLALSLSADDVAKVTPGMVRGPDYLSPEALDAIAARVAEKLRATIAEAEAFPGDRRRAAAPARASREALITIRVRRPVFARRRR